MERLIEHFAIILDNDSDNGNKNGLSRKLRMESLKAIFNEVVNTLCCPNRCTEEQLDELWSILYNVKLGSQFEICNKIREIKNRK